MVLPPFGHACHPQFLSRLAENDLNILQGCIGMRTDRHALKNDPGQANDWGKLLSLISRMPNIQGLPAHFLDELIHRGDLEIIEEIVLDDFPVKSEPVLYVSNS